MPRALVLVLDSVGIGSAPDAAAFGDAGADTIGHIAEWCAENGCHPEREEAGALRLPNLVSLGFGAACQIATGRTPPGLETATAPIGRYGCARELSRGKDTPSGHWEIAGVPVPFEWGYFPRTEPAFPHDLVDSFCRLAALPGILGNCHASGTEILTRLGEEHVRSGKPICYTSADSVFQIAAHEDAFGLERLYDVCGIARRLLDAHNIGRVIARPFVGSSARSFARTANRRDYAVKPPTPTLLDLATAAGREVISVGKIGDIFAHSGTGREVKAAGNGPLFEATLRESCRLADGGLLMTNFIDFDTLHGHRRDPGGYAAALEAFDCRLPELVASLRPDDVLVITADHGCDPTWHGTDHTRELVPLLVYGPAIAAGSIGCREGFADIAATVAQHLDLPAPTAGRAIQLQSDRNTARRATFA